jgi:hypothetical protein
MEKKDGSSKLFYEVITHHDDLEKFTLDLTWM